ncbi:hypothetical protein NDU88_003304 [Pleurodeles waltl]|uniref:Uncharacterized protein n=1 Tax=Pleurodeles waltl TaxID=8319 RepID=A0AAV7RI44_PLEWA|nr:hypothetical protein NDU88_003304 [Pleurodeles waltl]
MKNGPVSVCRWASASSAAQSCHIRAPPRALHSPRTPSGSSSAMSPYRCGPALAQWDVFPSPRMPLLLCWRP